MRITIQKYKLGDFDWMMYDADRPYYRRHVFRSKDFGTLIDLLLRRGVCGKIDVQVIE